jgi:hypothetical protein
MCNIGMQLHATLNLPTGPVFFLPATATITKSGSKMVFATTAVATIGELATWHRHEKASGPLDDFQVPNCKAAVKCDGAKSMEAFVLTALIHQFDSDFSDFHGPLLDLFTDSFPGILVGV